MAKHAKTIKLIIISGLLLGGALLSGCDENKPDVSKDPEVTSSVQNQSGSKSAAKTSSKSDEPVVSVAENSAQRGQKTSAYIKASNAYGRGPLDGTSAWPDKERSVAAGIVKKDYRVVESFLYFNSRGSKTLKESLEKTLADKGVILTPLDDDAQALLAALNRLVPVWEQLEKYNTMKQYEDDQGTKGKTLMEDFTPAYQDVSVLFDKFSDSVHAAANELKKQRMEEYRIDGRLLELYSEESIELASGILGEFSSTKDFKNKDKVDRANTLLSELESKLERQAEEYQKAEIEGKSPASGYKRVNSELSSFVGNYRKARKNPGTWASYMVNDFNRAIDAYNRIR